MTAQSKVAPAVDALARLRGLFLGFAAGLDESLGRPELVRTELGLLAETVRSLTATPVDFEGMVTGWVAFRATETAHVDTREPLDWLARNHLPPGPRDVRSSSAALIRSLPVAALASGTPVNLVSGTYHLTALWTGDPASHWSAVAVSIAAAQFLRGRKDFVPDAIEAIRANDAPDPVLAALRRLPFGPAAELDRLDPARPVDCMHLALWFAYREPRLSAATNWVRTRHRSSWLGPLLGALLGARDGEAVVRRELSVTREAEGRVEELIAPLLNARQES